MHLECRELEIKYISEDELKENKYSIIELLEDNLLINFPNVTTADELAIAKYDDIVSFKKDNSAILIGAFKEKKIMAFLWAYVRNVLGEERIHINHIIVKSGSRNTGIGSRLLKKLEEFSEQEGIKKLELITTLDNENTIEFYKSKGFTKTRVQLEKDLLG